MPDASAHVHRQILVVSAVAAGLFVSYPASFATPYMAFLGPLSAEFDGSRTIPSLGFALATLGQAVGALFVGPIIQRKKTTDILLVAVPLLSSLVIALAISPLYASLFLALNFAIGITSAGAGVGLYLSLLNRWFDARLGRAVGCALLGMSTGMLVLPVGVQIVIDSLGWRNTYVGLAIISLVVGMLSTWLLIKLGDAPLLQNEKKAQLGVSAAKALKSKKFWAIALSSFLAAMSGFGVAIHGVAIYRDLGSTGSALVSVTALLGIGSITGRFGLGLIIDRIHAPHITALAFCSAGISSLYLAMSGNSTLAMFFIGLALGAEGDVIVFFTRRYFGNVDHATIYNRLLAMTYLGGMAGPPLLALARDNLDSYQLVLSLTGGTFLLAAMLVVSLGAYPYPAKTDSLEDL